MFPFLLLPREIRDKIYGCLFQGPSERSFIFLHSHYDGVDVSIAEASSEESWTTLPDRWEHLPGWSPSGGLPLFRTCKFVRSEAAACLYGRNWFLFNDEYSEPHRHTKAMTPRCGIPYAHSFLQMIGSENRKSIRRLFFEIHHPAYLIHNDDPVEGYSSSDSPRLAFSLGEHLVDIFELLSQGHSLDVVGFEFVKQQLNQLELHHIFLRDVHKSVLLQTMMKLGGSIKLAFGTFGSTCRPFKLTQSEQAVWTALRSHLAGPSEDQPILSERKAIEPQAQNMSPAQLQLTKRHTELTKRIEERDETLAQ